MKYLIQEKDAPTIRATVYTYTSGSEARHIFVPHSIWVQCKNGRWIRQATLKRICARLEGADVTITDDAILITGDRFLYIFKTYDRRRLTPTKQGTKKDEK